MDVGVQRNRVVAADAAAPIVPKPSWALMLKPSTPPWVGDGPTRSCTVARFSFRPALSATHWRSTPRALSTVDTGITAAPRFDRRGEPLEDMIPTEKKSWPALE